MSRLNTSVQLPRLYTGYKQWRSSVRTTTIFIPLFWLVIKNFWKYRRNLRVLNCNNSTPLQNIWRNKWFITFFFARAFLFCWKGNSMVKMVRTAVSLHLLPLIVIIIINWNLMSWLCTSKYTMYRVQNGVRDCANCAQNKKILHNEKVCANFPPPPPFKFFYRHEIHLSINGLLWIFVWISVTYYYFFNISESICQSVTKTYHEFLWMVVRNNHEFHQIFVQISSKYHRKNVRILSINHEKNLQLLSNTHGKKNLEIQSVMKFSNFLLYT